jgi:hypothetical protein
MLLLHMAPDDRAFSVGATLKAELAGVVWGRCGSITSPPSTTMTISS